MPSAKQKLEDRLAAAAREKLAQASKESKEKQLQAERKRKAALFLQTLRSPFAGEPEAKRIELDSSAQLEVGDWFCKWRLSLAAVILFILNLGPKVSIGVIFTGLTATFC